MKILILMACALAPSLVPAAAVASKPIRATFSGCVLDGFLLSVDGYHYKPRGDRLGAAELAPHEGKKIEVSGWLNPGDSFTAESPIKVLGDCDKATRAKTAKVLAWAHRTRARDLIDAQRWDEAIAAADRALALEPKACAMRMTRAQAREGKGLRREALVDAEQAVKDGCTDRESMATVDRLRGKAPG